MEIAAALIIATPLWFIASELEKIRKKMPEKK
jgi:hypothetical protein